MTVISEWKREYAGDLARALNNKKILDNLRDGLPYPYTEKDALDYIDGALSSDKSTAFVYAVVCDGKCVGSVGAFRQGNIHSRTAELGYYLAEEYWGRGIMTLAVREICERIFSCSDIMRIYAEPFARNISSCRVLEKAGFKRESILRANAVKCGVVEDMVMYSRLKSD